MAQLTYTASDVAALVRRARTDPLGPAEVLALLDDLRRLHRERDAMLRVLDDLAPSWRQARAHLNAVVTMIDAVRAVDDATPDPRRALVRPELTPELDDG